mgnify:CR=1 FL=1
MQRRIVKSLRTKSFSRGKTASRSLASKLEDYWLGLRLQQADVPAAHLLVTPREQLGSEFPDGLKWLVERVHGSAKKYIIDSSFDQIDEHLTLPGLSRPILLRRKNYFDVLDGLRSSVGVDWKDVVVLGDIFELDLCLPFSLGATVGLMKTKFSPTYEVDYLDAHERGATFWDLNSAADWLAKL